MTTRKNKPLFAWITEFGVAAQDAKDALDGLEARVQWIGRKQSQESEREYGHCLMAGLGETDIIEIAYFTHIYHFFEIAETAARSSRNSLGARCLTPRELSRIDHSTMSYHLCDLEEVLQERSYGPFLAILYSRLSAAARLCVPAGTEDDEGDDTLTDVFLDRFFERSAPVWQLYQKMWSTNSDPHASAIEASASSSPIRMTPLIGLDSLDLILIFRAENLEQIAALTFAVRHQRLGSVWPAGASTRTEPYVTAMLNLLPGGTPPEVIKDWNVSPLFKELRTVWGLPVRAREKSGPRQWEWGLEPCEGEQRSAASAAASLALTRAAADRFKDSLKPVGLMNLMTAPNEDTEEQPPNHALMMFGRTDSLWLPASGSSLREITLGEIRHHFQSFTGFDLGRQAVSAGARLKEGLWPATELAVRMKVPKDVEYPTYGLMKRFRRVVHGLHVLDSDLDDDLSWTFRWKKANKELASPYSTTNTVVNMISSFMADLEDDPEGFADLLPALYGLIEIAERANPTQGQLLWLVTRIKNLFSYVSHRYFPLQSFGMISGFEGYAGYRRAEDAFIGFMEAIASEIAPNHQILVLERAGGVLSCELGPFGYLALWVSPFILHYPIAWQVVPELVHARINSAPATELPLQIQETFRELVGHAANPGDKVGQTLHRVGESLSASCPPTPRILVDSLRNSFTELIADLVLWRSVHLAGDTPQDACRRFWFVHGPGLIGASTATFGIDRASISAIQYLIARVFFVNYLIYEISERKRATRDSPSDWAQAFNQTLERLEDFEFHLERWSSTYELDYRDRSVAQLHCLRLDLRIPREKWLAAVGVLRYSLESVYADNTEILVAVRSWLEYAQQLVTHWLLEEPRVFSARALYNKYLDALIADWSTSDPWPPFIEDHGVAVVKGRNDSVDRSRIRGDDPAGGFISLRGGVFVRDPENDLEAQRAYHVKTGILIQRLADHARRLRFRELRDALQRQRGVAVFHSQ